MDDIVETDVLVVGAGPAGLNAASEAGQAGLDVVLVDENVVPGGQISRQRLPAGDLAGASKTSEAELGASVRYMGGTTCVGFRPGREALLARNGAVTVARPQAVVLAVGALERSRPVPGWTLPGVMTAGAAQTMLKGSGVVPFRRAVVAGSGPLLLAAASQLLRAGVKVEAVVEASRPRLGQLREVPGLVRGGGVFVEGMRYLAALGLRGVPVFRGWGVGRVVGVSSVEGVEIRSLDRNWLPKAADESVRKLECDLVLLSFGFTSSTDLAATIGARLERDELQGAWRPWRSESFETSEPAVWAVGDCAGVEGAQVSALEGTVAGLAVVERLTGRSGAGSRLGRVRRRLGRLRAFERAVNSVWKYHPGSLSWANGDTPVCRCEGTMLAELESAVRDGATSLHTLKLRTRAGMGRCQGRTCTPLLSDFLESQRSASEIVAPPSVRFPVRPVSAGAIAEYARHADTASSQQEESSS
jgi:D-hydroxyproline dehydrogenase subunit alpha